MPSAHSSADVVPALLPQPRALLFFLAHQDSYRKPLFSRKEIFCGPDTETRVAPARTFALRTPVGSYDVADILRLLPADQQPELVIVKADATRRNFPRNLGRLSCPKILLVGDTHHLASPLQEVIGYAKAEPFDFIVFDHTRHHAHWFAQAGLRNLHWLPALDYGFVPRKLKSAPSRPLTFVGQTGRHHPYRCAVLAGVKAAGLPLELLRGKLNETADIYADSQITLNVSLNGDLNLRIFEALSAGGFLLTDELTEQSGLPLLFESGRHLATWRTPGELIEKIRHYLKHPAEAQRIRAAGQAELVRAHHPDVKLREFHDLVFSGRSNPRYDLALDRRVSVSFDSSDPAGSAPSLMPAYETLQEIHRNSSQVTVYASAASQPDLLPLADLPRLQVLPHGALEPRAPDATPLPGVPVLWLDDGADPAPLLSRFAGAHVFAPAAASPALAAWGFSASRAGGQFGLHCRTNVALFLAQAWQAGAQELIRALVPTLLEQAENSNECTEVAEYAGRLDLKDSFLTGIRRAIALDRNNQRALLHLAALALEANDEAGTCLTLEEAARVGTLPPAVDALRRQLSGKLAGQPAVASYAVITHRTPPPAGEHPRRILVVTNLFPPQELGGYGRMIWEFVHGLRTRGHAVRVLTGQAGYLEKTPNAEETELEKSVSRILDLAGSWRHGRTQVEGDPRKVEACGRSNAQKVVAAARKFEADLVLVGNLDFLGVALVQAALGAGYPVLHALANARPGYGPADQPTSPHYWVAPCSDWNGRAYCEAGFSCERLETLHPGARLDRFYRLFLPDTRRLRIAYASLVMPYKGAHVLVQALARLHQHGVDFTAEIAGDSTDPKFVEQLKGLCAEAGMTRKVSFPGFLDRESLGALFSRSNVLVFPSQFAEPFGISQVEALAAGLVVVSSGTGGASEIIRHNVDGLLFKAADGSALAEQLHSLATQPELFSRLQQQGQVRALDFSVDRAVYKIETLAGELLAAREAVAPVA